MASNSTEGEVVWVSVGHGFFDYYNVGIAIRKQCHLHILRRVIAACLDVNIHLVPLHCYSRMSLKHPADLWCRL
jgi:hypothetical protein